MHRARRPDRSRLSRRFAFAAGLALVLGCAAARGQDAPPAPPAPPPAPPAPPAPPEPPAPPGPTPAPGPTLGLREGPGVSREQMWRAPTAEDWKKPCLMTWQRSWDDAVAVAKETGRAILVCVNMDGEIASEHYAGVRYREPEVAAVYEPYVCVIASVYRHNPRDHDDEGRRIPCPRFGTVTCGEHIALEPVVFERFLDGVRVAPRHIMVELDGKETFDVYYANDTASVFDRIRRGTAERPPAPAPVVRGDRPLLERVASRDVRDREAVEAAYAAGDAATRKALLEAAARAADAAPTDLVRLGVFGVDPDLSRLARKALAASASPDATDLVIDALKVPAEPSERDDLLAALSRMGSTSPRARWLASVHRGLFAKSSSVDAAKWSAAGGSSYAPPVPDWDALEAERARRVEAAKARSDDPAAMLAVAETSLDLAKEATNAFPDDPKQAGMFARHLYADARHLAAAAEKGGASGWKVDAILCIAAYRTSDHEEAYARAERAAKALPPGEPSWNAMAVLTIFAEARWKAITQAVKAKKEWPPEWLADVHAAYTVLLAHPLGTDTQVVWYHDFLVWLGADARATRLLEQALDRFRASAPLHERYRGRLLTDRGPDAVESAYDARTRAKEAVPADLWFAGLASNAVAEHDRRVGKPDAAVAAYGRAAARLEAAAAAVPAWKGAVDAALALVDAGRARLAFQRGDDAAALEAVLASFRRSPASAGTRDGLGITPGETAQVLLARLRAADRKDDVKRLEEALTALDPELLKPDRE
ncbi:MAG: hypothetical protein IT460_02230 [Planctomycetes bacterium]|nr:hypothetical protein [Planctomycetota bacterium]